MSNVLAETWTVAKPAVESSGGVVTSQHYLASEVGARVLAQGGNAMDAAVATSFALGVVEPWLSGLGGCAFMVTYSAAHDKTYVLESGVRSPLAVDPADYPLSTGFDSDLFNWPGVLDNRNVMGPWSVAVPGLVAGLDAVVERFATWDWGDLIAPAIELAERGLRVDWYSSLKIASAARDLSRFPSSQALFLPDGQAPVGEWGGPLPVIDLKALYSTLQRLAVEGADSFYRGSLAEDIVRDASLLGMQLGIDDLENYTPVLHVVDGFNYRNVTVNSATGLSAGPTLQHALSLLEQKLTDPPVVPDGQLYGAYVAAMNEAYAERLCGFGDTPEGAIPSCTTHLHVVDREGNVVALTQTLLSLFGSKVVLPDTGILMNNGMMWFDPIPGRANSIAPGKRPLSNMCPVIICDPAGCRTAIGASGGRRIMSAVLQILSFMVDCQMTVHDAMRQPRIDVSGGTDITIDTLLDPDIVEYLSRHHSVIAVPHGVYPSMYACPGIAQFDPRTGNSTGAAFVMSPVAAAVGVD